MSHVFNAVIFLSSFLLFLIQPMIAKAFLPYVGGAPSVWVTSMFFFQVLLLVGYGYAMCITRCCSVKTQVRIHLLLLLTTIVMFFPVAMPAHITPELQHVERWLIGAFFALVGMPYILLSTHSSLLQQWLHKSTGQEPYHLFSWSNSGSFLGLFSYPFLFEWWLPVDEQMQTWCMIFYGFTALMVVLMVCVIKKIPNEKEQKRQSLGKMMPLHQIAYIVVLGFIPSSLFISTTSFIATDIASFPLLWIIPLALYLLSFILVFARNTVWIVRGAQLLHVPTLLFTLYCFMQPMAQVLPVYILGYAVIAISVHARAAQLKPSSEYAASYFFFLSLGGALGGLFNTLAPYLFDTIYEYPLVLVLSVIGLSGWSWRCSYWLKSATCFGVFCVIGVMLLPLISVNQRELQQNTLFKDRNYFGVLRVMHEDDKTALYHGITLHGFQLTAAHERFRVVSYYFPMSQLVYRLSGVFHTHPIGVVGLGAGTLSCIAKKNQEIDFFEINPMVIDIAKQSRYFSFVSQCPARPRILEGDGRLLLQQQPNQHYTLIIIDAFSSDLIPLHLLTQEAISLYFKKLIKKEGVLALHISNKYIDLVPAITATAHSLGYHAYVRHFNDANADIAGYSDTKWMLITPNDSPWHENIIQMGYAPVHKNASVLPWTDSYSNVLPFLNTDLLKIIFDY